MNHITEDGVVHELCDPYPDRNTVWRRSVCAGAFLVSYLDAQKRWTRGPPTCLWCLAGGVLYK